MIAPAVLGAQVEKSFTYYVAPGGNDSHAGTKAAPFATVDHAVSILEEGQSVGVKRGGTYRLIPTTSEPLTNASLKLKKAGQRIGPYGTGTKPILTPAKVLTSWTAQTEGGVEPILGSATGGGVGNFFALTIAPVGTTTPTVAQSGGLHVNATSATVTLGAVPTVGRMLIAAIKGNPAQTLTPPAGFTELAKVTKETGYLWIGTKLVVEGTGKEVKAEISAASRLSLVVAEITGWNGIDNSASSSLGQSPYTFPSLAPTREHTLALFFGGSNNGESTFVPTVPAGYTEVKWAQGDFQPLFSFSKSNITPGVKTGVYSAVCTGQRPSCLTYNIGSGPVLLNETTGTAPASGNWSYSTETVFIQLPAKADPATATMEGAVSNILEVTASNVRISGVEFRHGLDRSIRFRRRGIILSDYKAQFCSSAGNGGIVCAASEGEGSGFSRITRGHYENNLNDGIWFGVLKDTEIDFITGEKFDPVERQNGTTLSADLIQLSINLGGNVGRLWVHDIYGNQSTTLSGKGITIFHGDGDPVAPKEGEVTIERVIGLVGNFGATAGMPGIKIRDCFFLWTSPKVNWGGSVTSNEIDGHITGVEISEIVGVGASPNTLGFGNGIAFEDGESWQHAVNIHDNLFVNCGYTFLTLNSAELDGTIERNRMAIIESAPAPVHGHIGVKHGPGSGKTLTIDNNVYPSEFANAFRGPSASYATLAAWRTGTGYDTHSKVEAITEATVLAEIEAKLGRLSKRIVGKTMTYAEAKSLV